jgi:hypothetical protein
MRKSGKDWAEIALLDRDRVFEPDARAADKNLENAAQPEHQVHTIKSVFTSKSLYKN